MRDPRSTTTKIRPNILRLMVENAVDAQYLVDLERDEFLQGNPALCELLGRNESQLIGSGLKTLEIIDERDRAYVEKMRAKSAPAVQRKIRFRALRPNKEVRWVEAKTRLATYMGRSLLVGSARDVTEQVNLELRLRKKVDAEAGRAKASEEKAREAILSSNRSYQMFQTMKALPEFSKVLSAQSRVADVLKEACLFITNREKGLPYSSCTVYVHSDEGLEVAYANPFRLTTRIETADIPEHLQAIVSRSSTHTKLANGALAVPIRTDGELYGVLEIGYGKLLESLVSGDAEIADAQLHTVLSIADFLGILISNLKLRASIRQQVIEDSLTGLFNRRHFQEKLNSEFRRASRYQRELSLILLDIDHFKAVNDHHGHAQGDHVLRELGKLLRDNFREMDTIARVGGEEIAIILPETGIEMAAQKAESVREIIASHALNMNASKLLSETNQHMHVSVSMGVSSINSGVESADHLYKESDRALYLSKNSGRNRVSRA